MDLGTSPSMLVSMVTREQVNSLLTRIDRAEYHIRDLEARFAAFVNGNPYQIDRRVETTTQDVVFTLRIHDRTDRELGIIVGDAVRNLRCALDHLACQLVAANGGEITGDTGFPIGKSQRAYEFALRKRLRGASEKVLQMVSSLTPYKDPNSFLWLIDELARIDRQRVISVITAIDYWKGPGTDWKRRLDFFGPQRQPGDPSPWPGRWYPLHDGQELYRVSSDEMDEFGDPEFTFALDFFEGGEFDASGYSVIEMLWYMTDEVRKVTALFGWQLSHPSP